LSDCDRYVDVSNKNFVNNSSIKSDYSNQEWLQYHVVNNLYGWTMSQMLPNKCAWCNKQQLIRFVELIRNKKVLHNEGTGAILKVHLKLLKSTDFTNFPLAPETKINRIKISI